MTRRRNPGAGPRGGVPGDNGSAPEPAPKPAWISRVLARSGAVSPDDVGTALRAGRVRVGGRVVREPMTLVRPSDRIELDGRPLSLTPATVVLAFHKPAGVVVSTQDAQGGGTVFDLLLRALPPELARYRWHAVGRLDRNTTGLLLFTNDERFIAHATLPATHLAKRYVAHVFGELSEEKLEPLRRGLELEDGATRPAIARIRAPGIVELTLTEGRNHQVKRMLGAVGLPVHTLHREAIGGIELDVAEGAWRRLEDEEIRRGLAFDPPP